MKIYILSSVINGRTQKDLAFGSRMSAEKQMEHWLYEYDLQVEDTYDGVNHHDQHFKCDNNNFFRINRRILA